MTKKTQVSAIKIALTRLSAFGKLIWLWLLVVLIGLVGAWWQFEQQTTRATPGPELISSSPQKRNKYQLDFELSPPRISAKSVWVYDRVSDQVLWELNSQTATAPASLVKLMTSLIVFESLPLEGKIDIGEAVNVPGNRAKFLASDQFSVRDLLKASLMFSANDASLALASASAPLDTFVNRMNLKARKIGLTQTKFENVTGLDQDGQYTTAKDLGLLTDYLLEIPFFEETVREEKAVIKELKTGRQDVIYTTNSLLSAGNGFAGVKTGTTDLAGQNLIVRYRNRWAIPQAKLSNFEAEVNQNLNVRTSEEDLDLILVILGSQDRYADAKSLVNWLQTSLQLVPPSQNPLE